MVVRLQSKAGRFILDSVTSKTTVRELQLLIQEKTNILPDKQKILCNYPPKEISHYEANACIFNVGISNGDTVIVQELTVARKQSETKGQYFTGSDNEVIFVREIKPPLQTLPTNYTGQLNRKVVPADNSCLFKSISILIDSDISTKDLRQLVAGVITSQPEQYTAAILGRPNQDYVEWILKDESWGGGIELSVFSELFQIELDIVDIQSQRIDKFGIGKHYPTRGLLIYDGIHYDPLVLLSSNDTIIQRVFPLEDDAILIEAMKIAKQAYESRQYTDVANFSLRCLVCGSLLRGHTDAQLHATATGHINFGEV